MWGTQGDSIAVSDYVRMLTAPARRNSCYSARELKHRAALVRRAQTDLSDEQYQAVLAQIPRGYAEGFEALDARHRSAKDQLTDRHPQRLKLLNRIEDVPYTEYEGLLRQASIGDLTVYWDQDTTSSERATILAEADFILKLLRFLIVLSLAGKHKFPGALALALLYALLYALSTPQTFVAPPGADSPSARVLWPPGRSVRAEPRVTRAPGRSVPLVVPCSEGRAGLRASGGTL
jgi:hypothetical protein